MALPQYTIEFHQGETFELAITYKDSTGCALDLSGSTAYDAKIEGRATAAGCASASRAPSRAAAAAEARR